MDTAIAHSQHPHSNSTGHSDDGRAVTNEIISLVAVGVAAAMVVTTIVLSLLWCKYFSKVRTLHDAQSQSRGV